MHPEGIDARSVNGATKGESRPAEEEISEMFIRSLGLDDEEE